VEEPTDSRRDAASTIFNLPAYRVIDAVDLVDGTRRVVVESTDPPGCTTCGVIATRVHSRRRQRLRDVPVAGHLEVVWLKRRWFCDEAACPVGTFAEATVQLPRRSRSTARLREALVHAVIVSGRAMSEVARAYGVSWWAVQAAVTTAALVLPLVDAAPVRRLGIDEHRYRSVRFVRDGGGRWQRFEPWMTTLVDLDTGRVLGVVDGRDSAAVATWLQGRDPAWLAAVQVVAIDPSAAFRKALRENLPHAAVSVDAFHLVKLANDTLTRVRQRLAQQVKGRRGRLVDPAWANRRLLLRGADTLTPKAWARLQRVFLQDDPSDELSAAWAIKEQVRRLLKSSSLEQAHTERMRLRYYADVAKMEETDRLRATIDAWWPQIQTLITTGATNARTEAANTSIKHIKRTGRGYRNGQNYQARILLASAARTAA
jgi:transposase